jgi:hypothetical protein
MANTYILKEEMAGRDTGRNHYSPVYTWHRHAALREYNLISAWGEGGTAVKIIEKIVHILLPA